MLDGTRRGMQEGMSYARRFHVSTPIGLRLVARAKLAQLRKEGFAHLDPPEKFIDSFVVGVQQIRQQGA